MTARRDRLPQSPAMSGGWVTVADGVRLYIQADAKTAPSVLIDARGAARADIHNAFPLPVGPLDMGGTCDRTTPACRECYAAGIENLSPALARNASHNLATLRSLYGNGGRAGAGRVVAALVAVVEHSARQQTARGVRRPAFRWQSGGDLFAPWYARAIRETMRQTPTVDHWLYTRDNVNARHLLPVPDNGRVYLSADEHNAPTMARTSARLGLPVAVLADDRRHAVAVWAQLAAVAPVAGRPFECPATGRHVDDGTGVAAHVVGPDGRRSTVRPGAPGVGACIACAVCLPGGPVRPVTFLQHGGKGSPDSRGKLGAAVAVRVRRMEVTA